MNQKKAIVVIGAGDATGSAVAKRFAREGYIACVISKTRSSGSVVSSLPQPHITPQAL
jgi:NAD(P)-dependent dehydrogenase (short-subunit alcohol dehydrogenase family)